MKNVTRFLSSWKPGTTKTINVARGFARKHSANTLQVSGLACIAAGGFVIALWLGLFMAGAFLCLIGWAVDDS
ncbi:hypothetical protein AB0M54_47710 [Actinoplanes sp. NPDC051470]|uniref:hypothetical protein n=1 Tax=Actinoplanes sp. NPDC051470 TaxID=3157224 RepID=UPI003440F522